MNISVLGLGYVGCVSAACLAELGHTVVGLDVDRHKVDAIANGQCPIVEPGLPELVARGVAVSRMTGRVWVKIWSAA